MEALMKMQQEDDDDKALEYKIEEERAKLDPDKCTPVTKESFEAWHAKMVKKRRKLDKEEDQKIRGKGAKGVFLTGRALLKYDEKLFKSGQSDDEGHDDDEEEKVADKNDEEDIHELRFGLDEEEAELNKEIAAAKGMKIDEELFDDDEDVDLDDLE